MDSVIYDGSHSVIFDGKDSWRDWDLVPLSRFIIPPPELNLKEIEIPGRNGKVDLSTYLTGHLTYKNRAMTFDFYALNGLREFHEIYDMLSNHLIGKDVKIILSDDPTYYYHGRCIPLIGNGEGRLGVQITTDLDPFKRSNKINSDFIDMTLSGSRQISVEGTIAYDSPTITTSSQISVVYNGISYTVPVGTHTIYELQFGPGSHVVTLNGTATVTFDYRGGVL